ncbi:hypothetical protein D3C80_1724710 [compost metagenome]
MAYHRHNQTVGRLRGDADMHTTKLADDVGLVIEMRIETGLFFHCLDDSANNERQKRQTRAIFFLFIVEAATQLFQLCNIDLFDDGNMRNMALRLGHAFGNLAAKADDLDLVDRGVGCITGQSR